MKKLLSIILCAALLISMLSVSAFAASAENIENRVVTQEETEDEPIPETAEEEDDIPLVLLYIYNYFYSVGEALALFFYSFVQLPQNMAAGLMVPLLLFAVPLTPLVMFGNVIYTMLGGALWGGPLF